MNHKRAQKRPGKQFKAVSAVLLDIDNTLYGTGEFTRIARGSAVDAMIKHGLPSSRAQALEKYYELAREKGSNYGKHLDELCVHFLKKKNMKIIEAGVIAYRKVVMSLASYPDVPPVLLELYKRGFGLYIASDGKMRKQIDKLHYMGISDYFPDENIFISERMKIPKSPAFFRRILQKTKLKPEQCMMIGDSEERDIVPAKETSMHAVKRMKGDEERALPTKADLVITHFWELLPLLGERSP